MIKYTSTKLYNPDIYNQSMFIEHVTNFCKCRRIIFPYENSNNLRLVFSHWAFAQCHRMGAQTKHVWTVPCLTMNMYIPNSHYIPWRCASQTVTTFHEDVHPKQSLHSMNMCIPNSHYIPWICASQTVTTSHKDGHPKQSLHFMKMGIPNSH